MGSVGIQVEYGEIDEIIKAIDSVRGYFNDSHAMTPAVRAMGSGFQDNFRSEGGRVGGWKPLKFSTILTREKRGYKHGPKLHQSGALEKGAIFPFSNWPESQTRFNTIIAPTPNRTTRVYDPRTEEYSDDVGFSGSGPTTVIAGVHPRTVFASVSGAKAINQTGGNLPNDPRIGRGGFTNVPARPFWFFDQAMVDAAAVGIIGRFQYYAFRYMPHATGVTQGGWSHSFATPGRPSVTSGPGPGMMTPSGVYRRSTGVVER